MTPVPRPAVPAPVAPSPAAPPAAAPSARAVDRRGEADSAAPTGRRQGSDHHRTFWAVLGGIAVLLTVAGTLVSGGGTPDETPLSAEGAGPGGAQAVVEVLRSHGVTVHPVTSLDEARRRTGSGPSTVLISDPGRILTARKAATAAALGSDTVWIAPDFAQLQRIAPGIAQVGASGSTTMLAAACTVPAARRAGRISSSGTAFRITSAGYIGCFPTDDRSYLVAASTDRALTILGSTAVLRNATIGQAGNAALALGLLGSHATLVWYLPGADDLDAGAAPDLASLTPGWVTPVMLLAILVAGAAAVWRGRRFGALVIEDLPVVVRAQETMEGRARLYQRSGSRLHALDAVRIGALGRITRRLGLPRTADVREVVDAVSEAAQIDRSRVAELLVDRRPADDGDLVHLATSIDDLEQAMARAVRPEAAGRTRPAGLGPEE